ncbi:DUF3800 domain-containing protein [Methylomonas fluvii]|uniref:DUF3800 domain-containing protein n=1 Tax=Methylomonas fluvii TaxID=1854564 RepID=A0ABR9DBF3_9GAMM|nr:DUF3800 domain-containing protein [Methylomonas fluvii]MBD9360280.1 DUF3800 domain-containing protein [Methylomonas fluvii]
MNIFIDESGSFVNAPKPGSWNSIAAYMTPEGDRKNLREIVKRLKRLAGEPHNVEVKLNRLTESQYFDFLSRLGDLHGVLFSVATDAGLNELAEITDHQRGQVEKITEHKDKMHHETAREGIQTLSEKLAALAPQLYIQLQCQVCLLDTVVRNGVLYFAQRQPKHLGRFRWRIDQKNSSRTEYEKSFVSLTPAFLQTSSLSEPMIMLTDADYSAFDRFSYSASERPTYLKDAYGIKIHENGPVTNIGMLIRKDIDFVDSKQDQGVQVADLLASGIRRCLRQEFSNNELAAHLLGRLMVQNIRKQPPISFLGFTKMENRLPEAETRLSNIMERSARNMIVCV